MKRERDPLNTRQNPSSSEVLSTLLHSGALLFGCGISIVLIISSIFFLFCAILDKEPSILYPSVLFALLAWLFASQTRLALRRRMSYAHWDEKQADPSLAENSPENGQEDTSSDSTSKTP